MTLRECTAALRAAGIENAAWEARLLFSRFGGFGEAELLLSDPSLSSDEFLSALRRREDREPLQYILGEVGFFRETYLVTPDVLIPRSDTELLVEEAIRRIPRGGVFADLGTGSGCIAVSVLANRTDLSARAYDRERNALLIAEENARRNGVADRISFSLRDLLAEGIDGTYDAILSNPPYIPTDVIPTLSKEVRKEPEIALDGGADGMDFYRAILAGTKDALKESGFYLFEIGYDEEDAIRALAASHGMTATVLRDLSGNPRVAYLAK